MKSILTMGIALLVSACQTTNFSSQAAKVEAAPDAQPVAAVEASGPARPVAAPAVSSTFSKALSSGYSVTGNLEGIEAKLVAFLEDGSRPIDKTTWFNFDRLTFKTGSSDLDLEKSKAQLTNVAEILKAFPAAKLKVGGYTDNVGKVDSNQKLSTARAKSVSAKLAEMGVAMERLDPEGYGHQYPECPANDTDECREKNRRIAVRVTAK